jgi:hypothetical protein
VDTEEAAAANWREVGFHGRGGACRERAALKVGLVVADVREIVCLGVEVEGVHARLGGLHADGQLSLGEEVEAAGGVATCRRKQWLQPVVAGALTLHLLGRRRRRRGCREGWGGVLQIPAPDSREVAAATLGARDPGRRRGVVGEASRGRRASGPGTATRSG